MAQEGDVIVVDGGSGCNRSLAEEIMLRFACKKGIAGIVRELRNHAIDPYEVLWGFPDEYLSLVPSQEDAAFTLLCRKPPRAKNLKQAAYAKLIRSGYSSAVAAEATKRWYESREKPGQ